jgi:hypothetical protein
MTTAQCTHANERFEFSATRCLVAALLELR